MKEEVNKIRKHTFIKRAVATILAMCMMVGMGTTVFAEDGDYIVTHRANEITKDEELVVLAIEQLPLDDVDCVRSSSGLKILTATQLLEERAFANGVVEQDIAVSQIIPKKEFLEPRVDASTSEYASDSVTGHSVSSTFYYTVRLNQTPLGSYQTYRFDKIVTRIVKTASTGVTYSKGTQMYLVKSGIEKWQTISYNNSSSVGSQQTYTLNSSHSSFYAGNGDMWGASMDGVFGQVEMDFSNGEYITFQFNAWQ